MLSSCCAVHRRFAGGPTCSCVRSTNSSASCCSTKHTIAYYSCRPSKSRKDVFTCNRRVMQRCTPHTLTGLGLIFFGGFLTLDSSDIFRRQIATSYRQCQSTCTIAEASGRGGSRSLCKIEPEVQGYGHPSTTHRSRSVTLLMTTGARKCNCVCVCHKARTPAKYGTGVGCSAGSFDRDHTRVPCTSQPLARGCVKTTH